MKHISFISRLLTIFVFLFLYACGTTQKEISTLPRTATKAPQNSSQLNRLKGLISLQELESASLLQQAIEYQQKGADSMALSLLNKTDSQSVLKDYIQYYKALSLARQKKYTEAQYLLPKATKPTRQIDKELLSLQDKIQKHAQSNSEWTENKTYLLTHESSAPFFENQEEKAFSLFKFRDYENAIKAFNQLLETGAYAANKADILVKLAQSHARLDHAEEAIKTYEQLLRECPLSPLASQARYKIGFLYFDSKQYQKAIDYFEPFLTSKDHQDKEGAFYYRSLSYFILGQYQQAINEIEKYKELPLSLEKRDMASYWKARATEKLHQKDLSQKNYLALEQQNTFDYYGLLAKQRRVKKKLNVTTLVDLDMVSKWGSDNTDRPSYLEMTNDGSLLRAILLYHINLDAFAFDESLLSPQFRNSSPGLRMLAGNFTGLNFPLAYQKYVEANAKSFKINPSLIYAIMKQESAFKPQALSSASAHGLMQVIPPTACDIAQGLGLKNVNIRDLHDPQIGILFGSFYLKQLYEKFSGNLILTMAAYNAGPEVVSRWYNKHQNLEADLFIEMIPYSQTREYVKKTLANYWIYEKTK